MAIHQRTKSLVSRGADLAEMAYQLEVLDQPLPTGRMLPTFESLLARSNEWPLRPHRIRTLQINMGKKCNQSCAHCHVDAGPDRTEMISRANLERCLELLQLHPFEVVDITGGAPELHPDFRWFVKACRQAGVHVIDRCNLTIIPSNPRFSDLPEFLAEQHVEIVSSLPYFSKLRTDSQRGDGVFEDSIAALKSLNEVGYGMPGSPLSLHLVYNPTGAFLPGNQASLEAEFKRQLLRRHGVYFHKLFVITNLPISRFLDYLLESGNYADYMEELVHAFNPATLEGLMCRDSLSISWDGYLYDCDFNQMLDLRIGHINEFHIKALLHRNIEVRRHCFGCTAGAGSSCGGALLTEG